MGFARRELSETASANKPEYETSFVVRSHSLLSMGYVRLDAPSFAQHEEEDITGELTRAMQAALHDSSAPRWAKHFWASEETRLHEQGRLGKRRRRIDVEIMQHGIVPRRRFRFEGKRLHNTRSRREYLGGYGLGRFLRGRYGKEDQIAGMLGYVQQGTIEGHASALASALEANPGAYGVAEGGSWTTSKVVDTLSTYRSVHKRRSPLPGITLLHTLLLFC
jgi:hypothetical protein